MVTHGLMTLRSSYFTFTEKFWAEECVIAALFTVALWPKLHSLFPVMIAVWPTPGHTIGF